MSMKKHTVKSSSHIRKIVVGVGIVIGLAFILYPFISQVYYDYAFTMEVHDFQEEIEQNITPELKEESINLANAYNEALEPNLRWVDPYTKEERADGVRTYAEMLQVKEKIGVLNVPTLSLSLPIYAGTTESILQKGVGHLEGTSLPVGGENTHSVLTAHRGLPEARLFTDLDKMRVGDVFYVETIAGELFYEVDQIQTVEPTETKTVQIVKDEDYLTLLTCTPYMINSHRLLIRGTRIDAPPKEVVEKNKAQQKKGFLYYWHLYWRYIVLIVLVLTGIGVFLYVRNKQTQT